MSTNTTDNRHKVTVRSLAEMKKNGEKIAMLTAYDYTMARIVDQSGIDVVLVGDSAANVIAGYETTLPITLDQMIFLASSVARGLERAMLVVDMPFGSYQGNQDAAIESAIRILKESGAAAVKIEGGVEIAPTIQRIVSAGIPVMGHLGLTPQSINQLGTYAVQAKEDAAAGKLINDAVALQHAGCFSVVLEKIPAVLATKVSQKLDIPTIGIGAGAGCDGQVLVIQDMLGMNKGFSPKFLRKYADLYDVMTGALQSYIGDVKSGSFPSESEAY